MNRTFPLTCTCSGLRADARGSMRRDSRRAAAPGLFASPHAPGTAASGFTLAELMAALAIAGILAAIAMAIAGGTVHAARAADARAAMLDTYQSAIRHTSTRGVQVVACPAVDGGACRDSTDWSKGWRLFEDRDEDRRHDGGERIVAAWPALGPRVHLRSTAGRKRLVFQPNGGNAGSNVTLTLCDGRGAEHARQLVLSNEGRLRETSATATAAHACMLPGG